MASEPLKTSTATGRDDTTTNAQLSDTEEGYGGGAFRVRSGTDISNALISRRYKFRKTGATRAVDFSRSVIQEPKPSISSEEQKAVDGINGEDLIRRLEQELTQSDIVKSPDYDAVVDDNDDNGDDNDNAEHFEDAFSRQTSVRNLEELRSALNL